MWNDLELFLTHVMILFKDDVCSYNSDDDVSIDRSDATYDVTYDVEYPADDRGVNRPVIQPDITEEQVLIYVYK